MEGCPSSAEQQRRKRARRRGASSASRTVHGLLLLVLGAVVHQQRVQVQTVRQQVVADVAARRATHTAFSSRPSVWGGGAAASIVPWRTGGGAHPRACVRRGQSGDSLSATTSGCSRCVDCQSIGVVQQCRSAPAADAEGVQCDRVLVLERHLHRLEVSVHAHVHAWPARVCVRVVSNRATRRLGAEGARAECADELFHESDSSSTYPQSFTQN